MTSLRRSELKTVVKELVRESLLEILAEEFIEEAAFRAVESASGLIVKNVTEQINRSMSNSSPPEKRVATKQNGQRISEEERVRILATAPNRDVSSSKYVSEVIGDDDFSAFNTSKVKNKIAGSLFSEAIMSAQDTAMEQDSDPGYVSLERKFDITNPNVARVKSTIESMASNPMFRDMIPKSTRQEQTHHAPQVRHFQNESPDAYIPGVGMPSIDELSRMVPSKVSVGAPIPSLNRIPKNEVKFDPVLDRPVGKH